MSSNSLKNISLEDFKRFLTSQDCKHIRTNGGHEVWSRKNLLRPIIIQSHISPVPEFIVKNTLKLLEMSREDFFKSTKK